MRRIILPILISIFVSSWPCCDFAPAESGEINEAEKSFLNGNYADVVSRTERLINAHPAQKAEVYYIKGLSELKLNKFADARGSFGYILSKYPGSDKIFDARLGIGDSYMLAGELNSAVGIYKGMLDDFGSNSNIMIVHSRLADCYKGLGLSDKAAYYRAMSSGVTASNLSPDRSAIPAKTKAIASQVTDTSARATAPQVTGTSSRVTAPQVAYPPARVTATQVTDAKARVTASQVTDKPVSNISPRDSEDLELIMDTGHPFSVQVGSFKNRKNAEKLAQKLASAGYESRVEIPVTQHDKLYRVKVGRTSSKEEIEALRKRLKASGYSTKICDGGSGE